jgi:hypothetical protein
MREIGHPLLAGHLAQQPHRPGDSSEQAHLRATQTVR